MAIYHAIYRDGSEDYIETDTPWTLADGPYKSLRYKGPDGCYYTERTIDTKMPRYLVACSIVRDVTPYIRAVATYNASAGEQPHGTKAVAVQLLMRGVRLDMALALIERDREAKRRRDQQCGLSA